MSYYELPFGLAWTGVLLYGQQAMFDAWPQEKGCAVMRFSYETAGSCATRIDIEIEAGLIVSADFIDGCAGNTRAVAALVKGMPVAEAVRRLKGIACHGDTSCPDQLARALEAAETK
ncbi:TIGR03905 family TSCPD domain-containing protein [Geobacter argillaceus]|uniref:TIGR03905 family TSCPD domain-containing protein n=1 Tax=Geobacter argillaceus TaxID=345631 RepID=UPI001FE2E55F|nr:TIGR03905 family TSCPD domain-containing protein [Geobacter argillaceus]